MGSLQVQVVRLLLISGEGEMLCLMLVWCGGGVQMLSVDYLILIIGFVYCVLIDSQLFLQDFVCCGLICVDVFGMGLEVDSCFWVVVELYVEVLLVLVVGLVVCGCFGELMGLLQVVDYVVDVVV